MKRTGFYVTVVCCAMLLFAACNKCVECDCSSIGGSSNGKICEKDFNNNEEFDLAVAEQEQFGCICSDP